MRSHRRWIALSIGEAAKLVGNSSGVSIKRSVVPAISRMRSEADPTLSSGDQPAQRREAWCQYHAHGHAGRDACVILAAPTGHLLTLLKRRPGPRSTLPR